MGNKDEENRRNRKRGIIYLLTLPRQTQDLIHILSLKAHTDSDGCLGKTLQ